MPREQHLKVLHELVDAAYDSGTLSHSFTNKGGKEQELSVSFTLPHSELGRVRDQSTLEAFKRVFDAANHPI